jgi:hypothetical protein
MPYAACSMRSTMDNGRLTMDGPRVQRLLFRVSLGAGLTPPGTFSMKRDEARARGPQEAPSLPMKRFEYIHDR